MIFSVNGCNLQEKNTPKLQECQQILKLVIVFLAIMAKVLDNPSVATILVSIEQVTK